MRINTSPKMMKHFEEVDDKYVRCIPCGTAKNQLISRSGNTSNLKRHIQRAHFDVYENYLREEGKKILKVYVDGDCKSSRTLDLNNFPISVFQSHHVLPLPRRQTLRRSPVGPGYGTTSSRTQMPHTGAVNRAA